MVLAPVTWSREGRLSRVSYSDGSWIVVLRLAEVRLDSGFHFFSGVVGSCQRVYSSSKVATLGSVRRTLNFPSCVRTLNEDGRWSVIRHLLHRLRPCVNGDSKLIQFS